MSLFDANQIVNRLRVASERNAMIGNLLLNELGNEVFMDIMNTQYTPPVIKTKPVKSNVSYRKKYIPQDEVQTLMKDECCICMEKHTMDSIVQGKCGHQMGKCCFQEWAKKSTNHVYCPLCRGKCNTMWEPMVPQNPLL